jgi:hypothetical protein
LNGRERGVVKGKEVAVFGSDYGSEVLEDIRMGGTRKTFKEVV